MNKENRKNGSSAYYEIYRNSDLFFLMRRVVWGSLPYLVHYSELGYYIEWRDS